MNHIDVYLKVSLRKVDSKVQKVEIKHFDAKKCKMANVMLENFATFFFGMSYDVRAFKVSVFASDLEFGIEVDEYK